MNIIDWLVVGVLAAYILFGLYRGLMNSILNIGAMIVSWIVALLTYPLLSGGLKQLGLFGTALLYTDGSERIESFEVAKQQVADLQPGEMQTIINSAGLPRPFGDAIAQNADTMAFSGTEFSTVGDYFDATVAGVVLNILSFFMLFFLLTLIFTVITNAYSFSVRLPHLVRYDRIAGGAVGLLRGVFAMFVLFTLIPVGLIALPVQLIVDIVNESFFTGIFYDANFFVGWFRTVV